MMQGLSAAESAEAEREADIFQPTEAMAAQ